MQRMYIKKKYSWQAEDECSLQKGHTNSILHRKTCLLTIFYSEAIVYLKYPVARLCIFVYADCFDIQFFTESNLCLHDLLSLKFICVEIYF